MKKFLVSISILFMVVSFLGISINAISTETACGVRYITYDDGTCVPYNGWTLINGQRTYYYKNGKRVTGLNLIRGVVYKFDENGKSFGEYTGKAKGKSGIEYYKFGMKLEFTTVPKKFDGSDFFVISDYKELMTEKMGGGWIKIHVRIDKVYPDSSPIPTKEEVVPEGESVAVEPTAPLYTDYSIYEGQEGYVYVPAMAARLVLEADGFCLSNDVIVDEMNYNNIIPIVDGKLKFYTEDDLVYVPKDFVFNNDGVDSVKDRKSGEIIKLSDEMTLADFDKYKELTYFALTSPKSENDSILSYISGAEGFNFRCTIIQ
jgi:hypothetical protein